MSAPPRGAGGPPPQAREQEQEPRSKSIPSGSRLALTCARRHTRRLLGTPGREEVVSKAVGGRAGCSSPSTARGVRMGPWSSSNRPARGGQQQSAHGSVANSSVCAHEHATPARGSRFPSSSFCKTKIKEEKTEKKTSRMWRQAHSPAFKRGRRAGSARGGRLRTAAAEVRAASCERDVRYQEPTLYARIA